MTVGCYDKAVELLSRRAHFTSELRRKLEQRRYPPEEIDEALARLERHGYLDDLACARGFLESRTRRGPVGRRRLRAELERRGAAPEIVAAALDEIPENDLSQAREAARSWRSRRRSDPGALARHLDRKGFSQRAILTLLEELGEEDPEELR